MDLKDDSLMMGGFSGPGECNLPMVSAYHEGLNLGHSLEPHPPMSGTSAPTSMSSVHMSQPSSQAAQAHNQSQTTATPVISLFKLKNFLYQPKFKNLLHSEVPNGVHNGGPVEDQSQTLHPSPPNGQLYSNAVSSRHSMAPNCNSTSSSSMANHNSVGQILGLAQPFKFSNHLQVSNGSTRKYQCKMCPQIFYSKADMQLHTQVHMREAKPYKCSQCSKSFANSSYLSQHTRIHLGIKPYRCDICQRKFTQLSHLQQHMRTHTGDKPYKCRYPNCTKAFSQLSNLQSHSRSHQTDKPFKCNSCYKCFVDEAGLLDHIPKHKESKHLKTHICQFCGKSYTQETYLAKHMQKHADRLEKRPTLNRTQAQLPDNYWAKGAALHPCQSSAADCSSSLVSAPPQADQCLQSLGNESHSMGVSGRFEQQNRLPMSGLSPINSRNCEDLMYGLDKNGNSAFTPLPSTGVLSGANVRMSYFSYESFNFPNKPSSGMEAKKSMEISSKGGHAAFPNQLIALNQIRNYASMPSSVSISTTEHHPIALKD